MGALAPAIALSLLKAGGDYRIYEPVRGKFANRLADAEKPGLSGSPETRRAYRELVEWLESQGEDFEEARKDLKRWLEVGKISPSKMAALRKSDIEKKMKKMQ